MAEYSIEWLIQNNDTRNHDFSIEKEFNKLKEGQSVGIICEGYGITAIIDKNGECFVKKNNEMISFEKLSGITIEKKESYKNLTILFIIISVIWLLFWIAQVAYFQSDKLQSTNTLNIGTFGDMFGSVNALFSGLALGGIIFTIHLQKKELKLQRKELSLTRDEFVNQNEIMQLQKFESTFFNLLNNHIYIIKSTVYKNKYGTEALENEMSDFIRNLKKLILIKKEKVIINGVSDTIFPEELLNSIKKFEYLIDNINTIIGYIRNDSNVKNTEMYYKLLYNGFTKSEKILFGFYVSFDPKCGSLKKFELDIFQKDFIALGGDLIQKNEALIPKVKFIEFNNTIENEERTLFLSIQNTSMDEIKLTKVSITNNRFLVISPFKLNKIVKPNFSENFEFISAHQIFDILREIDDVTFLIEVELVFNQTVYKLKSKIFFHHKNRLTQFRRVEGFQVVESTFKDY
jgi:hypothetical protein